ncbi:MAG: hypothetical protein ACRCVG_07910 [Methanobacteriaceae archaeon]
MIVYYSFRGLKDFLIKLFSKKFGEVFSISFPNYIEMANIMGLDMVLV